MSDSRLLILKAATPIHVGASEGSGIADMPIQRETATNIPKIESSAFKGALKDYYNGEKTELLFDKDKVGGQLSFTDLKLLFFPIKSSKNVFSLISCPYVLNRFVEDMLSYHVKMKELDNISYYENSDDKLALTRDGLEDNIYLGKCIFKTQKIECDELFEKFIGYNDILKRIVIVSNKNFKDFVSYYTDIVTRNHINKETGTSKNLALFTQEYLPDESIFYGIVNRFSNIFDDKEGKNEFEDFSKSISDNKQLKIGGSNMLGKGIMQIL